MGKKLFKKSGKAAKMAAAVDSDSDISMMTESEDLELEEERAALRAALSGEGSAGRAPSGGLAAAPGALDPFEQASLWAEVIHAAPRPVGPRAHALPPPLPLPPAAASPSALGPPPHQQVDRDELERIALNIARNAVPPAPAGEGGDAAARLNISAAVAERAEEYACTDPLGFGRIDTRLLTLVGGWAGWLVWLCALFASW